MPSFDLAKVHRVTVATLAPVVLAHMALQKGYPPQCCRKKPLTEAVQAFLLHRQASSDEPNLLEHLLRFLRACFSPVLLENVDECLGGGWIGWHSACFSAEGLI